VHMLKSRFFAFLNWIMFLTTSVNYNKYLWICYAQIPYAYVQMRNTTKIPKKWKLHANSENAIKSI